LFHQPWRGSEGSSFCGNNDTFASFCHRKPGTFDGMNFVFVYLVMLSSSSVAKLNWTLQSSVRDLIRAHDNESSGSPPKSTHQQRFCTAHPTFAATDHRRKEDLNRAAISSSFQSLLQPLTMFNAHEPIVTVYRPMTTITIDFDLNFDSSSCLSCYEYWEFLL
jgi:hypothetical protein